MIPEEMVPDLELCKHEAIKKLFEGKTYFSWCEFENTVTGNKIIHLASFDYEMEALNWRMKFNKRLFPAPTVAEMGDVFPKRHYPIRCLWECGDGYCYWTDCENIEHTVEDKKEANARAKMIIWLWENKYLRVSK